MDNILSQIKGRVVKYLEIKGISREEFYRSTGIAPSNFKGEGRKSELGGDKIAKILTIYTDLDALWLLTGRGDIFDNRRSGKINNWKDKESDIHVDTAQKNNDQVSSDYEEKEPLTSTGIPLSQVKAKTYATRSDEEIDRTISAMMERQLMDMYEEGRIYPRKAVEQLVASLQEANQKLQSKIAELEEENRRMQLKIVSLQGPEIPLKK